MPNWCSNQVVISHENPAKLEALAQAVREGKFCDHVIPVPQDLQITAGYLGDENAQKELERKTAENVEKYGFGNWYDFCTNRWGTKWEVESYSGEATKVENGVLEFGFESAWAPPMGVYEALVEDGFSVRAYYYEPGMCYTGKFEDGYDECYDYSGESSKTVRDAIGDELDDMWAISESMAEYEDDEEVDELEEFLEEGAEAKGLAKPDPIKFD